MTDPADQPAAPERAGFSLPLDMVIAPARGFAKIARSSEWVPAFVVIAALGFGALALERPALDHVAKLQPNTVAGLDALALLTLAIPLITAMMIGTTFAVIGGVRDSRAQFGRFFSLAMNCLVPSAFGGLVHAAAVAVHPASSYTGLRALVCALPDNLGLLAAAGNERELAFLQSFNIFDAWSFVLIGLGISLFAGMRFGWAIAIAAAFYFVFAYI